MTDSTGQAIVSYEYDAFGGLKSVTGTLADEFRFTGEQWDGNAGLYYLRARYYDPGTGRFVSRDPFPGFATRPASQNPYVYGYNNPANLTDPSGEIVPLLGAVVVGAAIGAGVGGVTAWLSGEDVVAGAAKGAVAGGVGVLGGAAGLALAGSLGIGVTGAAIIGGFSGGALSDVALQGTNIATGGQCSYDPVRTLEAGAIGAVTGGLYARGWELSIGKNLRLAPFGNRTGHPVGEFPHYHRRIPDPSNPGEGIAGQGIGRHRPWDIKSTDSSFWKRF